MTTANQTWQTQQDDILNVVADIDRPSDRIRYAFEAGYQEGSAASANENAQLRVEITTWEEFDFERDSPKRLVESVLTCMVERDQWQRRAEAAEATLAALNAAHDHADQPTT